MLKRIAVVACILMVASAVTAQDRVSLSEKGSLVVWAKVVLRFDCDDPTTADVLQDTFLTLTNDYEQPTDVHMFFVKGSDGSCEWINNIFTLTHNQPSYWAASTGSPGPDGDTLTPFWRLGLTEDPLNPGEFYVEGYVFAFAIDPEGEAWRHNHLFGEATVIDYAANAAFEYKAYTFAALAVDEHETLPTPGALNLDGFEYDYIFNYLLFNFFANGSTAFSNLSSVTHDTDVAFLIGYIDVRQLTEGPFRTKLHFDIWNEDEHMLSGEYRCIQCWEEFLLSNQGGHFDLAVLGTNMGYARVHGLPDPNCDILDDPDTPECEEILSDDYPLLGVVVKVLEIDPPGTGTRWAYAGQSMSGAGTQSGLILYDVPGGGEEKPAGGGIQSLVPQAERLEPTR